ncbi:MAG: peptidoglycan D,D-transpeptidase FtsI family protein [Micromonosporaceae bacterium]
MAQTRDGGRNRRTSESVVASPGSVRRGGISQARRYHPRGRTVRETAREADPYRPALQLLQGGKDSQGGRDSRGGRDAEPAAPARGGGSGRGRGSGQPRSGQPRSGSGTTRRQGAGATRGSGAARTTRGSGAAGAARGSGRGRIGAASRRGRSRTGRRGPRLLSWWSGRRRSRGRRVRLGNPMRRLRFGTVLVLLLFAVIAGRLVELQLTDARAYAADGLKQRLREVPLPAPRGAILDRDGAVLARSVDARYVYADPSMVDDAAKAAAALSPVLGIAKSVLVEKMKPANRDDGRPVRFVYLVRGVNVSVGDRVAALNLKGIGVHRDERREVPGHDLAANVIGFTGGDGTGLAGLEARYESVLAGRDGVRADEIGMRGVPIPDGYHYERPARPGQSVQLTIDRDLQYETQRILAARMQAVRATFGSALVLDVRSGELVAMASWPSYDAADPFDAPDGRRIDYNTAAVVEPGSVHKPLVIGAGLEEGVIEAGETPVVGPTIRKGGKTYRDTHWHETRKMTLAGILAHSSNVGTIQIADKLGAQRICAYQKKFGLGTPTGVGLPGEASGIVQPPDRWSGSSHGSIPIGLGVAVTPIQLAAAYAAIGNDGLWTQPTLVRGTVGTDGKPVAAKPSPTRRVLSPDTAKQLRLAMEAVTTAPDATGLKAAIPGYRVAGKTGTGLRVKDNRYMYGDVTSFVGMAPADAPRYVVAVFAHVPNGAGGGVAAPVFRSVMTAALQHDAVPPTGAKPPKFAIYA